MCGFKVGDEVVCVRAPRSRFNRTKINGIYTVSRVWDHPLDGAALDLLEVENLCWGEDGFAGHDPSRFRKVQKRNSSLSIESFLTIKPDQFEEPKKPVNQPGKVKA